LSGFFQGRAPEILLTNLHLSHLRLFSLIVLDYSEFKNILNTFNVWSSSSSTARWGTFQSILFLYTRRAQDSCTRVVHCASVRTLCRTCTHHRTIAGRSSVRVRSPSTPISDAALPSPATCRAGPFHALHACTACARLLYKIC
jgi:hypothetical protein